ncbi:class I SAM-dependent methyltransferase [Euzebya tangerina]|uniref:class I SAM-dependent methyltransferase n=1 Tax=Euzebya tangerina TaxID=591198 RepID=UPI0013C33AFC|nr:methyltransferase domain-containing protein [Euzebya tangerina]
MTDFDVDVVVLSNEPGLTSGLNATVVPLHGVGSLPLGHAQLFAERVDRYDLFVYSAGDILVTEQNLSSFSELNERLPVEIVPGFLRCQPRPSGDCTHRSFRTVHHWQPSSLRTIDGLGFAAFTDMHSAMYVVSAKQLTCAIDAGRLTTLPVDEVAEGASATSNFYTRGGLEWLICLDRVDEFVVCHLSDSNRGGDGIGAEDFRLQVSALRRLRDGQLDGRTLVQTETDVETTRWNRRYFDQEIPEHLWRHAAMTTGQVLSVGSTTGEVELALFPDAARVVGVPVDDIVGALARHRGLQTVAPNFDDALARLAGERFDAIWIHDLIHRVPNPPALLAELRGLLSADGQIIVTAPNMRQHALQLRLRRTSHPLPPARAGFARCGIHRSNWRRLSAWMELAGLDIERVDGRRLRRLGTHLRRPAFDLTHPTLVAVGRPGRRTTKSESLITQETV